MNRRDAMMAKNVSASFVIKGASLVIALLTMPAYIQFFENQQVLGVWFTVTATLSWILNFDVGLGNGLRNRLVGALEDNALDRAKGYISATYLATLTLVLLLGMGLVIAVPRLDWNKIFGVRGGDVSSEALVSTVAIILAGILAQFFFRTITAILYALQRSAVPALLNLITTALLLTFVTFANFDNAEDGMLVLAQAYALAVNLPLIVATLIVFHKSLRHCRPSLSAFRMKYASDVVKLGGSFLFLQLAYMAIANTNPLLISWLSSPEDVVDFQIYVRPFGLISSLFVLALTPVWSAVTEATAKGDLPWVSNLHKRVSRLAFLTAVAIFAFVPGLQMFVDAWLGDNSIETSMLYALAFAASASIFAWNGAVSGIVNGTGRLRIQAVMLGVGVGLKLAVALILVQLTGKWIWVVISDVAALLPYLVVQSIWLRRYTSNSGGLAKARSAPTPRS